MKVFSSLTIALLIIFQTFGFAATKTFSASGEYLMSDYDTPEIAEEIALDFAKQNAAEQAGVYLESYSRTSNFNLEADEIKTVANSKVEVLEKNIRRQPQSNGKILLRADIKATVDTSELDNFLAQAREQRQQAIQRYRLVQEMNQKIKQDIDALQIKIAAIKEDVKDEDLLVEQERINREFLSKQKLEEFGKKLGKSEEFQYDMNDIDEAIRFNPKNVAAYVEHAMFSSPPLPDINDIEKAIVLNPNEAALYVLRGAHYLITGNFNRLDGNEAGTEKNFSLALENYNRAIELDPKNSFAYVNRAVCYETLGEKEKALADYNKAIEINPDNKDAYEKRSEFYKEQNDSSSALKDRESAMKIGEENADGFAYIDFGDSYKEAGNYLKAIENYTKAIETPPQFAFADHRLPAYYARASLYVAQKEYDKALADCDEGIKLAKNSKDARADFWIKQLEKIKADIASLKKSANAPALKDTNALLKRAWNYFTAENYDSALNDLNELIRIEPKPGTYVLRAIIYERLKEYEKALADYNKAIELKPDYSSAYENRQLLLQKMNPRREIPNIRDLRYQADEFVEKGDYKHAIKIYTEILKVEPNYPDALFHRGRTYLLMKKYDLALADYEKLLELSPKYDSSAYNNRGLAHENLGNLDKALADYEKASELDPNNKIAKRNHQRVLDKMKNKF